MEREPFMPSMSDADTADQEQRGCERSQYVESMQPQLNTPSKWFACRTARDSGGSGERVAKREMSVKDTNRTQPGVHSILGV